MAIRIRRIAHLINTQKHTNTKLKVKQTKHTQREKKRYKTYRASPVWRKYPPGVTERRPLTERERNIQQRARFARNLLKNTQKHKHTQSLTYNTDKTHRERDVQTRVSPIFVYTLNQQPIPSVGRKFKIFSLLPLLHIKDVYDDQRQKNHLNDHHQTQKHDSFLSFSHKTGPLSHVFGVCFTGFHAIENRENLRFRART